MDNAFTPSQETLQLVLDTFHKQQDKHGASPRSIHRPEVDNFRKLRVLVEEVGEVSLELDEETPLDVQHLRTELAQTAAVCFAWLDSLRGL